MKSTQVERISFFQDLVNKSSNFYKQRLYNLISVFQRNQLFSYITLSIKFLILLLPLFSQEELFIYFQTRESSFKSFDNLNYNTNIKENQTIRLSFQIASLCLHSILFLYLIIQYFLFFYEQIQTAERKQQPLQINNLYSNQITNDIIQIPKHKQKQYFVVVLFSIVFQIHNDILLVPCVIISSMNYNPVSIVSLILVIVIGLICTDQDYDYLISSKDHLAKRISKTNYISLLLLILVGICSQQISSLQTLSLLLGIIYFIIFCIQLIWKSFYKQITLKIVQFGYLYLSFIFIALFSCYKSSISQFYCLLIMILIPITYKIIMYLDEIYQIYLNQKMQLLKLILKTKDKHLFAQIHPFELDQIMRLIFQDSANQKNESFNQTLLQQYYFVNQEQEDQSILNGSKRYVVKEEIIDGDLYVKKEQAFGNDEQLKISLKEIFKKIFKIFLNETSISQEKKTDIRFYYLIFLMQIQQIPQQFLMQIHNKDQNEMSIKNQQMLEVLLQKFNEQLEFEQKVEGNTYSYFNNSFLLPIIFEQITQETTNQLDKAINIKLNILYMMSNKFIDLEILNDRLVQIYKLRDRIVKNLNSLASMNQLSEELHYLYMNFLENLSFSERDVKINYQQKQLNYIQKHFFQEDTGVLFVSIQKERQNIIKKVSSSFCSLFKVNESDIINTEIDRFIPSQIQSKHKIYIQRFLENPNLSEQNIYKDMLFGIIKGGYILPIEMNLRLTQFIVGSEYTDDFGITALIKGIKQNSEFILYEHSKKNKIVGITENFHQTVFGHIKDFKKIDLKKFFPFLKNKNAIRQLFNYEKTLKAFNHTNTNNSSYFQSTTNVNSLKKIQTSNNIKNNDQDLVNNSQGMQSEPAQSSRHPQSFHSQYDNLTTFYDEEGDFKNKENDEDQQYEEDFPVDFVFIMIVEKPQSQFSNIQQKVNTTNSIQNLYAQVNLQSNTTKAYSFYQMRVNVKPFRNRLLNLNYLEIDSLIEINPVLCTQTILPLLTNNEIAEIKTNKFSVNQHDLEKFILELQNIQTLTQIQQQQGPVSSISEETEEYDEVTTPYIYQKRRTKDFSQKIMINNGSFSVNENQKSNDSKNIQSSIPINNKSKEQMEKVIETKEENENDLLSQRQEKIIKNRQINYDNQQTQNDQQVYQDVNFPLNSPIINSGHLSTNNMPLNMLSPKSLNIMSYQDLNNEYDNLNYTKNNDNGDNYKHEFSMNNQVNITQTKQIDDQTNHEANNLHNNSQSQSISYIKASTQISRNKLFSNFSEQSHIGIARQQKFFSKQQSQVDEQLPSEHKSSDKKENQENKEEKDLQDALEVSSTHSRSSNLSSTKKNIKKIVKTKKSLFVMKIISIVGFLCVCAIIGVTVWQYYQIISIFDDQIQNFKVFDWPMQIQSQMSLIQKNVNFQTLLGSRNQLPIASGNNVTQLNYQSDQELNSSYSNIIRLLQQMQQPSQQIQIFYYVRQTPSNFTYIPQKFDNRKRPNCTQNGTNTGQGGTGSSGTSGGASGSGSGNTGTGGNSGTGGTGTGGSGSTGASGNSGTGTGGSGSTGKGGSGSSGKGGSGNSGSGSSGSTGTGGGGSAGTGGNTGTGGSGSSGSSGNAGASGGSSAGTGGNPSTGSGGQGNGGGGGGNRNCSGQNNTNWYNQSNNQFNFSLFYSTMQNTTYTLDYSLLLQSENIFSYAFLNDDQGTSERGFITNMFVLKNQLNTVYQSSKQQMYDQLNNTQQQLGQLMIIIMIVLACCLIVVIPLFSFIQSKREQILKLFATFDSQKLEIKIIQLNTLYFQNSTSLKKGSLNLKTKLNQQIIVKQKQIQSSKKQILSSTSSLPRINKTILVFTAISYCLSIIYPLLNEYITSNYTQQGKQNTQLMSNLFEIQSFILASVAQNYFCLILKGFPNKKQFNITLQVQTLQDMYTQGQNLITNLQGTIQQQEFINRYQQNLYDNFLFELLNNNVCTPLNQYQQFQDQQNLIPQSNCTGIRKGILNQGLQISLKKFTEVFPDMLSMYQITDSNIFTQKFTAYQSAFNFAEFNTFATYLAQIISALRTFIIQNSEDYFNYMKTFQIALLIYQMLIMVLIFYFGWFSFYKYLDHQLFQTKLLLSVMDVNSLIENSYIYNFLKRNVDL
ncbi:transmembrane protein, putative (macronuclear) [Tetrahymena thermophila SB210]|uniref:Transmembrane protein, putative n=1 Tax=Tetrahymena thermophila (strain SB210) TaxID=312017 RepID=I7MKB3_TETTS|nr:transmembrane protein, putative [Tetrahymena thermophila SB210]EAR98003.2 transmembrane protein, putative [Tetrahymena thermophila SB210]|eukprot:XP_001018248.2 transmembrane protein, putative [Tetrahymena thermophila SB210]